ncbi:AAA family ATPase [Paenibacillus sp. FSL R5-0341]|uniref:AAA family ATPase n=1 Tax=Paenibacillus sp. FSL R5-0341 TaxID=2921636 RepID=UPI0030D17C2B
MNPWAIRFSGIRDFVDIQLELGDRQDHVLIGGPNGSGKSTISFCMGAVLASQKVLPDGLRSRNLPPDQVWRATIELVFENVGNHQVEAADYVGFRLNMEQKPGDPVKKEFWIYEGEEAWNWHKETRYVAGDSTNHLHEYRHQLQHKYKVDPDTFYLIWYQQDVNQFAVMRPEERFRIFSEMTGIDRMQKHWESVKEEQKEAQQALQTAESNQHQHKLNLGNWQQEKERLLSRNERRLLGLRLTLTASATLREKYEQEYLRLKDKLEEIEDRHGEEIDKWMKLESDHKRYDEEMKQRTQEKEAMDCVLDELESQMNHLNEEHDARVLEHRKLADQLQELQERIQNVPYAEAEVRERLRTHQAELNRLEQELIEKKQAHIHADEKWDALTKVSAKLDYELRQHEINLTEAEAMVAQYGASSSLELEAQQLEKKRIELQDQRRKLEDTLQLLRKERQALTRDEVRSIRQDTSIRRLEERGLTVYTLRDLLEMDEHSPLELEKRLEPIKYTLFVNGRGFRAPTDLYHVELPSVVPEKALDVLEEQGLRVKQGLDDIRYAAAQKALWWIHTLHSQVTEHKPGLQDGQLLDSWGRRGAQEKEQWLLNPRGVALRIRQTDEEVLKLEQRLEDIHQQYDTCEERLTSIRSIHQQIRTAEGVIADVARRDWAKQEWERTIHELQRWKEKRDQLQLEQEALSQPIVMLRLKIQTLQEYMTIYHEARDQNVELERLRQLGHELESGKSHLKLLERELEDKLAESDQLERTLESTARRLREKAQFITATNRVLDDLKLEKQQVSERCGVAEQAYVAEQQFYLNWADQLPSVLVAITEEQPDFPVKMHWNEAEARHEKEMALTQLQLACRETVDENALENYEKVKQEYDRGAQEVLEARSLLQQLEESLEDLEEKLMNTIHYEVRRIHLRFVQYMDKFSFDGEVSWDMQEQKQGNVKYFLHIKARKQGHRGTLEEISMKGRSGKVGKGVSGGEESLGSLLFALALMKTIDANPGYIMLDEFDSALDESRKAKVFELYRDELARKMIILSPKSHESDYLNYFSEAFAVYHDARITRSALIRIKKKAGTL